MQLKRVKPDQIKIPEIRVTAQFSEEDRAVFQKTIEQWGIETPILCFDVDGELVLVDGLNRLQEAKAAGAATVDVVVRPGTMIDVQTRNIFLDHTRGKHRVSDMIRVLSSLYNDYGQDIEKIQAATNLTRDYIERLLKIATASPEVLVALDSGAIGVGIAYELSRLPHQIQQEEVLAKSTQYRLKTADVKDLVDQTLNYMQQAGEEPVQAAPAADRPAPEYHCEGCKHIVDPKYLRPVFLCPDCFGAVWRLAKAAEERQEEAGEPTGGG